MIAEYNINFSRSFSGLGDEPVLQSTDDDLCHVDVDLICVSPDDTALDGLHHATHLLREDPLLQIAEEHYGLVDVSKGKLEGVFGSPGSDYLTGAYLNVLQDSDHIADSETHLPAEILQSDLDLACSIELSDSDDSLAYSTPSLVTSSCPGSPTTKKRKLHELQWSEMDSEEQERSLDLITRAITDHASLREQLELLRIVGQDMTVLPSDSRFHIDPSNIDDDKLKSIRDFLSQMAPHTPDTSAQSCKGHHSLKEPRLKKTQERRAQHKANRKRRNKERNQGLKEQRSGLFDREVVVCLQQQDDDDEEINILD